VLPKLAVVVLLVELARERSTTTTPDTTVTDTKAAVQPVLPDREDLALPAYCLRMIPCLGSKGSQSWTGSAANGGACRLRRRIVLA
jgi:hypothetical protein